MSDLFNSIIGDVLEHEGGYVDNPSDPGGVTKYGISVRFLLSGRIDVNNDGVVNKGDVQGLTKEAAIKLYKEYFWDKYNYENFKCAAIAAKVFDTCVNMGSNRAHRITQQSYNDLKVGRAIKVDGLLGINSLMAINLLPAGSKQGFLIRYTQLQQLFYTKLIEKRPELKVFSKGWMNRALWLPKI